MDRDRPALRRSSRRRWLIPGAILAAVAVAMLAACLALQSVVPIVGIVAVAALYAAMIIAGFGVRDAKARNLALAWLMGVMALTAAAALTTVLLVEASAAGGLSGA